jgi:hypothetical protein
MRDSFPDTRCDGGCSARQWDFSCFDSRSRGDGTRTGMNHPCSDAKSVGLARSAVLPIQFPDETQAVEREPRRDDLNNVGLFGDDLGQAACGDDFHVVAKFHPEAGDHAFDHADVTEEQTRLHGVDSVAANDRGRALNVDASEFGGVREECVGGQVDAGGDGAAEILTVGGDGVEGGGGAEINHAGGTAVQRVNGDRVGDAIRTDGARVFVADSDAGFDARVHDQRFAFEIFAAGLRDAPRQRRDDRGEADSRQVGGRLADVREQAEELQAIFIGHARILGGEPPMMGRW